MSATSSAVTVAPQQAPSLVEKLAARFNVEPSKMLVTLKQTAFRQQKGEVTNSQMVALFVVADQYGLNPWTREIYAFPTKDGGIVPVVGVDGWARIVNQHPEFDGLEFVDGPECDKPIAGLAWIECHMHRRDRSHPTVVREYLAECYRQSDRSDNPWRTHPRRFLRHKAYIQCARLAFGFVGIFDQDEAERIGAASMPNPQTQTVDALNARMREDLLPIDGTVVDVASRDVTPTPAPAPRASPEPAPAPAPADASDWGPDVPGAAAPAPTYAEVRAALEAATDGPSFSQAEALIAGVADPKLQAELNGLADRLAHERVPQWAKEAPAAAPAAESAATTTTTTKGKR